MRTYAYSELYVELAQRVFGDMFDYAVNTLGYDILKFHKMFIGSGMAEQFEIGNPTFVAGKNGCEVAKIVIASCGFDYPEDEDVMYMDKSREYWIGWALAYYQWKSAYRFSDIEKIVGIEELYCMYPTFHEVDVEIFVDAMDEKMNCIQDESRLKRLRAYANLSQNQLAVDAGVSLRQIQLFEQGQRDINKTQGDTLERIASVLGCKIEDLLQ